ncbi:hypothetical protein SDC9_197737 [bioreactor metagenome]|uniref:Uncharacterized protein n=1 Tax=bioreactor metagenome TaxID=1076179 RepID=A0A645IFL3_9ZZZZ
MCALSSALRSSYFVRRTTTSWRCSTNSSIIRFRLSNSGRPFTNAMLFTLKDDCIAVNLYSLLRTTLALASRLTSTTIRIPWRSDSSFTFDIPSIFFSPTKSAMCLINSALFTRYGISEIIILSWFFPDSISAFPRITIRPLPVSKASMTPL